jgi:hypothetical protein
MLCSVCNVSCRDKHSYQKHCKSAKHLTNLNDHIDLFVCEFCGKKYQYKHSLKFHQKKCTEYLKSVSTETNDTTDLSNLDKKQLIERINDLQKDAKMKQLESENESLKQKLKISELENKITHNTITNNTTNNITNNITINAFGKENLDYINNQLLIECIHYGYDGIPFLMKKIHGDPKHPENHNIRIRDKRLKEIDIMGENGEWEIKDRDSTIEDAVYKVSNTIRDAYDDNKKEFQELKRYRFEKYIKRLHDEENTKLLKEIAKETDKVILGFKKTRVK